jgi:hypothetical protein
MGVSTLSSKVGWFMSINSQCKQPSPTGKTFWQSERKEYAGELMKLERRQVFFGFSLQTTVLNDFPSE